MGELRAVSGQHHLEKAQVVACAQTIGQSVGQRDAVVRVQVVRRIIGVNLHPAAQHEMKAELATECLRYA